MPALAEPPVQVETPTIPQDGGFADRLNQTISADPGAARQPGFKAPDPTPATPTLPEVPDAPTGSPDPKKAPVEGAPVPEPKTSASDRLKKLALGEKEQPKTPPTQEEKKEFTMKELRLRAERADVLEKELTDARKEIETAKAAGATPDQIKVLTDERDAIKAEREDYKKRLAAADVSQSDEYRDNVVKPMEAIWGELKKASEDYKFPINELGAALNITDHRQRLSAISKVLDSAEGDMDILNKNEIVNSVGEFLRREFYGRQLLADGSKAQEALKANKARLETEQKEKSTQTFNQQADDIFKQMFSEEQLEDMPFLAPKGDDGKPKADKAILDSIRKSATSTKEPWRLALDSYSTELLPKVMDYAKERDAKIVELEDRIAKMSGKVPGGNGAIVHEDSNPDSKLTLQERVEQQMKAQGRM